MKYKIFHAFYMVVILSVYSWLMGSIHPYSVRVLYWHLEQLSNCSNDRKVTLKDTSKIGSCSQPWQMTTNREWCVHIYLLTHWGRVTHICVGNLTRIGSDNGLSPGRRQCIFSTNAGILLIGLLGTNISEFFFEILTFSFKKMRLKVSSAKRRPFSLGFNVLRCTVKWKWI